MTLPGFRAEASLHPNNQTYMAAATSGARAGQVMPQLMASTFNRQCDAACRCCRWGNRFCCSHCRWCRGPIGSTGALAPD